MRTYTFGDIHGCLTELENMLRFILSPAAENFDATKDKFVFVGDYIDRGPDSKGVIDQLIKLSEHYDCTFLRGNHDDMFLDYLELGGHYGNMFLYNGGYTTLASYGIWKIEKSSGGVEHFKFHDGRDVDDVPPRYTIETALEMIPEAHKKFFLATKLYHDTEKVLYVHAGLNPCKTLEENEWFDFVWVNDNRNAFFSRCIQKPWHKILVHGHTVCPKDKVKEDLKHNRINVDTGIVFGKSLTCLVVDDSLPAEDWKIIQHNRETISWSK